MRAGQDLILGGFVIHGNNAATLGAALDDLTSVCDLVVAIDSRSTDGSAGLVEQRGVHRINLSWQGYGAARKAAADFLVPQVDYLFFLDSDETISAGSRDVIRQWKASGPDLPGYTVKRNNWALDSRSKPYVYHADTRLRLVRRDQALWAREMIVHEALTGVRAEASGARIEHAYALEPTKRDQKDRRYALLWAIQQHGSARRVKPARVEQWFHFAKELLWGGAWLRGGRAAISLCWEISKYRSRKYEFLRRVRAGEFSELVSLFDSAEFEELFRRVGELQV